MHAIRMQYGLALRLYNTLRTAKVKVSANIRMRLQINRAYKRQHKQGLNLCTKAVITTKLPNDNIK